MEPGVIGPVPRVGLAILASFTLIVAACGGGDSDEQTSAEPSEEPEPTESTTEDASEPTQSAPDGDTTAASDPGDAAATAGGTLRVGIEADVDGLNPTTSALSAPGLVMASAVFDNLVAFDVDGNAVPYLAESIEPVDGDLTRWQLKVRQGVTFHDGTPLDADAVRINFEAQLASPLIGLTQAPFYPDEGAIEVIDEHTVEYTLLEASAVFPTTLATQVGMVASPTWLAAAAEDPTRNQQPVGTGPFVLQNRSQDAQTRVTRNDAWWGGEVLLDAVEFVPITDPGTRATLLDEGDIDVLHVTDAAVIADLAENDSIQNIIDDAGEEQFVMLNTSAPPFDDVRARRALALATPRSNYLVLIGAGVVRPADQMFTPESPFYNPEVAQEVDNPGAAAELAADYCAEVPDYCSGEKINLEYQYPGPSVVGTRTAEVLAEGWEAAFDVTFEELVQDAHIQQTVFGQYQAVLWRGLGQVEPTEARINFMCRTIGGISINFTRYCTDERDALFLEAQGAEDIDARSVVWNEISAQINEAYTHVFLAHTVWDIAQRANVHGLCDRSSPEGEPLLCSSNGRMWLDTAWLSE